MSRSVRRRLAPAPHTRQPWTDRFDFEVRANIGKPFEHGRKGQAMKPTRRKPKGIIDIETRRRKVGSIIWK